MTVKTLSARVEDAFSDEDAVEFGDKYLELVLDAWKGIAATLRRTTILLLVSAVAFQLLISADVKEFSFGPLKLKDIAFAPALIPVVASFLLVDFVLLVNASRQHLNARTYVMRKLYPAIERNDLDYLISPPTVLLWGFGYSQALRSNEPGGSWRTFHWLTMAIGGLMLFSGPLFLGYAYWELFRYDDASRTLVWAGLIICVVNVVRASTLFWDYDDGPPPITDTATSGDGPGAEAR